MLQVEHSFVIKIFVLSIFEWPFYTGTQKTVSKALKTYILTDKSFFFKIIITILGIKVCLSGPMRPKKKIVVFQVPCQEKTGSVGRLYFFFFVFTFFFANSTKQFFPSSPKKYRQCHQAVDPGDMYYGRSFINSGKSRDPASLGHPLTRLHRVLIISKPS